MDANVTGIVISLILRGMGLVIGIYFIKAGIKEIEWVYDLFTRGGRRGYFGRTYTRISIIVGGLLLIIFSLFITF
jgi:hypothetical protein